MGEPYIANMKIRSFFNKKEVFFPKKNKTRNWYPGINLWTYLNAGGVYPERQTICSLIREADWSNHHDIVPWNIVLSGKTIHLIDRNDSGHPDIPSSEEVSKKIENIISFVSGKDKEFRR